jgi:hypothetical protein
MNTLPLAPIDENSNRVEILERTVKYYAEREAFRNKPPEFDWRQPSQYVGEV